MLNLNKYTCVTVHLPGPAMGMVRAVYARGIMRLMQRALHAHEKKKLPARQFFLKRNKGVIG